MPPPLPPLSLGFVLGAKTADVKIDVFIDLCCPFSKKIFKRISNEVYPTVAEKSVKFVFYLAPQPWHPQSPIMNESVLAVSSLSAGSTLAFIDK